MEDDIHQGVDVHRSHVQLVGLTAASVLTPAAAAAAAVLILVVVVADAASAAAVILCHADTHKRNFKRVGV